MKKLQLTLVSILSSSLIFSGCSKQATYKGQTKEDWKHVYTEYDNAKKQRDVTVKQRDKLQKKCIDKTENGRISYSLSCTKQLKALNENIKYWDDVVVNRGKIIENVDSEQKKIEAQEAEEAKQTANKVWSNIKTTTSIVLVAGMIAWLATNSDKEKKDSVGFQFSF